MKKLEVIRCETVFIYSASLVVSLFLRLSDLSFLDKNNIKASVNVAERDSLPVYAADAGHNRTRTNPKALRNNELGLSGSGISSFDNEAIIKTTPMNHITVIGIVFILSNPKYSNATSELGTTKEKQEIRVVFIVWPQGLISLVAQSAPVLELVCKEKSNTGAPCVSIEILDLVIGGVVAIAIVVTTWIEVRKAKNSDLPNVTEIYISKKPASFNDRGKVAAYEGFLYKIVCFYPNDVLVKKVEAFAKPKLFPSLRGWKKLNGTYCIENGNTEFWGSNNTPSNVEREFTIKYVPDQKHFVTLPKTKFLVHTKNGVLKTEPTEFEIHDLPK